MSRTLRHGKLLLQFVFKRMYYRVFVITQEFDCVSTQYKSFLNTQYCNGTCILR